MSLQDQGEARGSGNKTDRDTDIIINGLVAPLSLPFGTQSPWASPWDLSNLAAASAS
ncbi:predicted protein [Chaetomium globosum CBS 148.51]|uniref:Uncharacterized protein n=1 Tax=Chaetomium globosum (strain ATCC 6205 / CBS 148.51 / DSM 1962 / NBRC 6347 / NRRL 1970) TaxID=306901 RepID=Q2H7G1_CHAGB|nr:uncharacterized protein CHGG_05404 [Chaetomium globosum CBS 148.51]EAQ88785.1 predicted protein [Chaetomium globosum CBS 148.51]